VVEQHWLLPHLYADDTHICRPSTTAEFQNCVSSCVVDVAAWMQSNRLQLNFAKTEVLWCASNRRQLQIPRSGTRISADDVMPSAFVRDLAMHIGADVSMLRHSTSSSYHIRRIVSKPVMQSLVVAPVLTRLYYGNATLAGLANQSLVQLQSILNAVARLIFLSRKFDQVTPLLRELHWLSFPEMINCKLSCFSRLQKYGTVYHQV